MIHEFGLLRLGSTELTFQTLEAEKKTFRKMNVRLLRIHMPVFKQLSLLPLDKAASSKAHLKLYYFILLDSFSFRVIE